MTGISSDDASVSLDLLNNDIVPNIHPDGSSGKHAVPVKLGLYAGQGVQTAAVALAPQAVYNGGYANATEVYVRIANGGAGQSGLIGAWANAFIRYMVTVRGVEPFLVAWYLGDTTESLGLIESGSVDVAVTYNEAAELQSMSSGASQRRVYGFRDHFLLVGPKRSNPAGLAIESEDVLVMFNKIVAGGNADSVKPPANRPPTRFLSRYDKSATNIKESELFITIGQVPWALAYSKWYHQYPRFPIQALKAAAVLDEYTITDRGTWLSSDQDVRSSVQIYKTGTDDAKDPLLNPAHVLLAAKPRNAKICAAFMDWVISKDGGQKVIREFKRNGEVLYTEAPTS